MRRSALFLLALHLAAGPVLAQTSLTLPATQPAAPTNTLEVRTGNRVTFFPNNQPGELNPQMQPSVNPQMQPLMQPPAPPVGETLVNFDPQHVEVTWSQRHWQLVVDGQVLKDFGQREMDARVAMRLVRDLHLTQHGVVGAPQPVMEYWLANGHAPHGLAMGLHLMPVDAPLLRVEQTQGQWVVRDNSRVLFSFGTHESEARNALTIMRKYGFSQIGFIGDSGPSMLVMLGHADADTNDPTMPHLTPQSPLHPANDTKPTALQQAKFSPNDMNPQLTPAILPLRNPTEAPKPAVNAFGHMETVETLPANDPNSKLRHTPPPSPGTMELIDRTQFDDRRVVMKQDGKNFVVAVGSLILGRFNNDRDARQALAVLQHYHFTEVNRIGRPQVYCSYFLCSGGEAPLGQYFGVHSDPIAYDKLRVGQVGDRWAVLSGETPLILFGARPEEAHAMLDVIQRLQFDRICHIGDEQGMTYFVRNH